MVNIQSLYNKSTEELRSLQSMLGAKLQAIDEARAAAQEQRSIQASHLREVSLVLSKREQGGGK